MGAAVTPRAWARHKSEHCSTCRHDTPKRPCVAKVYMDDDPNDIWCAPIFRNGTCTQHEERPKRKSQPRKSRRQGYASH